MKRPACIFHKAAFKKPDELGASSSVADAPLVNLMVFATFRPHGRNLSMRGKTMARLITALSTALLFLGSTVYGQTREEMPNEYLDGVAAKLIMAGFQEIRLIDEKSNTLVAYDEWGSEVVIVIDPYSRKTLSQTYVHLADE